MPPIHQPRRVGLIHHDEGCDSQAGEEDEDAVVVGFGCGAGSGWEAAGEGRGGGSRGAGEGHGLVDGYWMEGD